MWRHFFKILNLKFKISDSGGSGTLLIKAMQTFRHSATSSTSFKLLQLKCIKSRIMFNKIPPLSRNNLLLQITYDKQPTSYTGRYNAPERISGDDCIVIHFLAQSTALMSNKLWPIGSPTDF